MRRQWSYACGCCSTIDVKVIFFAPHAAIWVHAFPEALVAEALARAGHEIVYVTCGRQLRRHCVPMSAHGLTAAASQEQKRQVCDRCEAQAGLLRREFALAGPQLADLVDADDERTIEALIVSMHPQRIE